MKRLRGTSSQVYTRCTPGTASAADLSIETMRAWACGECSTFRCSMPSISVSIVNSARPVTTSVAAGAPTLAPTACPGGASSIATTPLTASSIARYPVQRQRFPFSARGRSCFCASVKVAEVMIMPAVQKPHWKPGASRNCRCIGCRFSGVPRPSIVVTSRPSARNAGVMQLCTGSPSSHTVHAPQSPASQPFLTPWWPSERTNVRRHWPGRGSSSKVLPFTVYVMTSLLR